MNTAVIGLGKLGAPFAAALAASGSFVYVYDKDPAKLNAVDYGRAPVDETGLQELMDAYTSNISTVHKAVDVPQCADLIFLVLPTPSKDNGRFNTEYLESVLKEISPTVKRGQHTIVIVSTVMPGDTRRLSKLVDCEVVYMPMFIALGSVIGDIRWPNLVLMGTADGTISTGQTPVEEVMSRVVLTERLPLVSMTYENAELAKLAVNTFVTMKISFANTLAAICEQMPTGDVDRVTVAAGIDRRIGNLYLRGATPYGGPCFPRDTAAFSALLDEFNLPLADLATTSEAINSSTFMRILRRILDLMPTGKIVSVVDTSYKPDTQNTERAFGWELLQALQGYGIDARAGYTPEAQIVVLTLPVTPLFKFQPGQVIVDCWRVLHNPPKECEYHAVGVNE